jgi:hypothetical protein
LSQSRTQTVTVVTVVTVLGPQEGQGGPDEPGKETRRTEEIVVSVLGERRKKRSKERGPREASGAGTSLCVLTCDVISDTLKIKRFTFYHCAFIILCKSMPRQMQAVKASKLGHTTS